MHTESLQRRAQRLGLSCAGLSERQIKEALYIQLLRLHRKDKAAQMIAAIDSTPDVVIDAWIETLETEHIIDHPEEKWRSQDKLIRFGRTVSIMEQQKINAPQAARIAMPELAKPDDAFRKLKKLVTDLERLRAKHKIDILIAWLRRFKHDRAAMRLWGDFMRNDMLLNYAYDKCNALLIIDAQREIGRIFRCRHPFAFGLVLLFAPTDIVWQRFGPFFERLQDDRYRRTLFEESGNAPRNGEQTADAVLELLRIFGLFPSARKRAVLKPN